MDPDPSSTTAVLVVDDSENVFLFLKELLSEVVTTSYTVEWEPTYRDGLDAMLENRHDVYLLDYVLDDDQDGLELLRTARKKGCKAPAILLTGKGDREVDLEAMRSGASDYLIKGDFGAPTLDRCIRYAIGHAQTINDLRESQERYELVVRGTDDGIWDWKLDSEYVYYSDRWKAMLGYEPDEIGPSIDEWYSRVQTGDHLRLRSDLGALTIGATDHFEREYRMLHKDGEYRWFLCRGLAVCDQAGRPKRIAGSQSDITRRTAYDSLTGLPNLRLFMDRLERAVAQTKRRDDYLFGVLFLGLDRFKLINDSLGHVIGDQLLIAVSERLKSCLRTVDTIARLGGDEFVVLLEDVGDASECTRVVVRCQKALSAPVTLLERELFTTVSVGIALGSSDYECASDIIRDADTAMHRAKKGGTGRRAVFDAEMHASAVAKLELETELRRGVERQNLEVFYQPILSLDTDELVGFEALVRWRRKRGEKLILPEEFVGMAEETGLILAIDAWVLKTACEQLKSWNHNGTSLSLHVNLSGLHFNRGNALATVDQALRESGIDPACLTLELTESIIVEDFETTRDVMIGIKGLGACLALDDFGTGYSSLSYLHKLPIDELKVDRSFVAGLSDDSAESAIIETIIGLGQKLGFEVTAEGVETVDQLKQLKAMRCTYAQGYLLARPMPTKEATAFISSSKR